MRLSVNPNDKTPIYRQLYEQIASEVLSGGLPAGTPLPPIRTVSRELGVSMITVRSAWDMLERDGYLLTRTGSGCFVAPISETHRQTKVDERLSSAVDALVTDAKALGVDKDALIALIGEKYR
ncbi:MAG: GntR family transcriptional regulator [Clostridia bacterium]|nr:GntR family transcriptional regulator [Clostridia bacterium]